MTDIVQPTTIDSINEKLQQQQIQNVEQTEAIKKLVSVLERDIVVGITGNRTIKGKLVCLDKQENILLSNAYEELFGEEKYNEYLEKKKKFDENIPESERTQPIKPKHNGRKELGYIIIALRHITYCKISKKPDPSIVRINPQQDKENQQSEQKQQQQPEQQQQPQKDTTSTNN